MKVITHQLVSREDYSPSALVLCDNLIVSKINGLHRKYHLQLTIDSLGQATTEIELMVVGIIWCVNWCQAMLRLAVIGWFGAKAPLCGWL